MKYTIVYLTLNDEQKKRIQNIEGYDFHFYNKGEHIKQEDLDQVEVIIGQVPASICNTCKNLKLVLLDCAGVDRYKDLNESITLLNGDDVYGEIIGEWMTAYLLAIKKRIPEYLNQQQTHAFTNLGMVDTVMGKKILVVGMGNIGRRFAYRMHALGAIVDGVTRTKHDKEDYVSNMYTMDELDGILGNYDTIALILPETKETIGYFNEERLLKMDPNTILMNVGRGSAIVTSDLVKVLQQGHLRSVYLDVFEHEPLPKNHILWRLDNVLITPHVAGRLNSPIIYENILNLIVQNLTAYKNNTPLTHVIDRKLGY